MRDWAITSQFAAGVQGAEQANAAFPAFRFQPFTTTTVEMLVKNLPPLSDYRPLPHPDALLDDKPTRFAIPLKEGAPVAQMWLDLADYLKGDLPCMHIARTLGIEPAIDMHPAVALIRDLPGYKIRIHPDSAHKVATVQIYLAAHDRAPHIGVRFYRRTWMPETFIETDAVPYLPGSGYFFRRTEESWHGVMPTSEQDGERNSLMLIYFDSPKAGFA